MSLMTHPATLWLRGKLRKLGITKAIGRLRSSERYEAVVETALLDAVLPNDIVWDVGANVGFYTLKLAEKVGAGGLVYAFEPSSVNLSKLMPNCHGQENVKVIPVGLSSEDTRFKIRQGLDDLGATTRIEMSTGGGDDALPEIEVRSSDSIISSGAASAPNVLKIDVEGHEYDVLLGAAKLLVTHLRMLA